MQYIDGSWYESVRARGSRGFVFRRVRKATRSEMTHVRAKEAAQDAEWARHEASAKARKTAKKAASPAKKAASPAKKAASPAKKAASPAKKAASPAKKAASPAKKSAAKKPQPSRSRLGEECAFLGHLAHYAKRGSPSYSAAACAGRSMTGNDGREYKAMPHGKTFVWRPL